MKKLLKLGTLLLVFALLFNLVACSSFNRVQKALEDAGYKLVENEENDASKEAEESEKVTEVYVFTNKDSLEGIEKLNTTLVTVIEFKSTKELVEYFKESNTLQGIVKDLEEEGTIKEFYEELKDEGFACGNCLIIPLGLDGERVLNVIEELND